MNKEIFLYLKRAEVYERLRKRPVYPNVGFLYHTWLELELFNVVSRLQDTWEKQYPPERYYQLSKGEQFAKDDEFFLSLSKAVESALRESEKYPEIFYVIWCYEIETLPYPLIIVYDKKQFSREQNIES